MRKVIVCSPRGFCAGVIRAIQTVEKALEKWGGPIYVKHEIVHNRHVVDKLRAKGAIFVEDLQEIPRNSRVIYSAHGVPPSIRQEVQERGLIAIDATCGLVTRIHSAVKMYAKKGYHIILIGKRKHVEVIGICGEAPDNITVVENLAEVESLLFSVQDPLFYVMQTTLSMDDAADIVAALKTRYPQIITLPSSSICYATQNRQGALRNILPKVEFVYVIGDPQSSNSNRLREVAARRGVVARLINSPEEISEEILHYSGNIGVTAGASTPEDVVQACLTKLQEWIPNLEIETDLFVEEDMVFQLPKELQ
ncbi:penicillin tolerance protein LytB,4-hydroxy-3-methylbut-2-enyl diphosphate reductase,4-hydroxy-3-methylbut-2-enyl diphosphate reductase,4-hydroxy-3-methylbut-2-enyl diphosphate reductase,LytB protein [Chlamydia suis]|uniref:4-hydroxy-3-methylbut-2-enyl diphosphate reductase n=1 Tax=Chlamydia suis TaxID=83559 RepID=UPI0009B107F1|nr:4-hydroxy-3-methylbut-2-enyl diphosphate reductase [Chlamydia suis]SIU03913.1 penicillin tolerance protein LytB,4-hydroxy-3-methylbut-2-enyl diphosphate reductase,4-hydroxy-3-methylbut-2-enyl diphosphate reductase,4-hydroxy-3-methylbut-2-enyl diphosphate reductase,LytB protein [Chlamydia suis]